MVEAEQMAVMAEANPLEGLTPDGRNIYGRTDRLRLLNEVVAGVPRRQGYSIAKRAFDIIVSSLLLIASLPTLIAVAILIKVTSAGPVFFKQVRSGQGGSEFFCLKFRTMVNDAERVLKENAELSEQFGADWKLKNDPRVTGIGRWLRKSSIDELPQLINVLRGEMSIVGPRPVQPAELEERFGAWAEVVTRVKPGITGLWQVSGRSELRYDRRVALDLEYVGRCSFWFDISLLIRTVPAVLTGRGAV
jgi:lipopolysaccharide/colanic/teichoic acid biosynthesis glycosyltransferase